MIEVDDGLLTLMERYADGSLDASGCEALDARLRREATAREAFREFAAFRCNAHNVLATTSAEEEPVVARLPRARWVAQHRPRRWALAVGGPIAAAAMLVAWVWMIGDTATDQHKPVVRTVVGVLTDASGASWSTEPIAVGEAVRSGAIALAAGRAEVQLHSGVLLEVIGPASLQLKSSMHATLSAGTLSARAVEGFTVETPRFTVVDLGTEFSVSVGAEGAGEVHVFDGQVRVRHGESSTVVAGRGMRVSASGSASWIEADRSLAGLWTDREPAFVRWSFDESEGPALRDTGVGHKSRQDAELAWTEPGVEGPDRVEGRYGRGLGFDGKNDYVRTTYAGIGGSDERTVAMWVRIPLGAETRHALALLGYGRSERGRVWQVSWNSYEADGPIGALRVGVMGSQAVGTSDLRDGRWHHVAASYDGESMRLYVDGKLEREAAMPGLDTATGEGAIPVTIGRNIAASASPQFFRGEIDEVYILDAALDGAAIHRLMQRDEQHTDEP